MEYISDQLLHKHGSSSQYRRYWLRDIINCLLYGKLSHKDTREFLPHI